MSQESPTPARKGEFSLRAVLAMVGFLYLVAAAAYIAGQERSLRQVFSSRADFYVFRAAGALMTGADRQFLYDVEAYGASRTPRTISVIDGRTIVTGAAPNEAVGHFYNPPLYAFFFIPFSWLAFDDARYLFNILCAVFGIGIAACFGIRWRSWTVFGVAALAIAAFWPAWESVRIGHASLLFALISALALVLVETRRFAAGVVLALLSLKPQMLLGPAVAFVHRSGPAGWTGLGIGLLLFLALPFLLLSPESVLDFQRVLSASREDSFRLIGEGSAGASWMFNWNGFWAYALLRDPPYFLVLASYAVTAVLAGRVLLTGSFWQGWLASTVAATLIVPHFLIYDLVILLPAMLALAFESRHRVDILIMLAGLHVSVNLTVGMTFPMTPAMTIERTLLLYPLVGTLALAYMGFFQQRFSPATVSQPVTTAAYP